MSFGIERMVDYSGAMNRVEAWYNGEVLDRAPIRFSRKNEFYDESLKLDTSLWATLKDRWFDAEYQVDTFIKRLDKVSRKGETFPVFWPNLGPEVYSAFFGSDLEFGEVTAWARPSLKNAEDIFGAEKLVFSKNNPYYKNLLEQTHLALEKCKSRYLVGMTSWATGANTLAAWIEPEQLCKDLLTYPKAVNNLLRKAEENFRDIYDEFYNMISVEHGLPSVSWLKIPTNSGKQHILKSDFSSLISTDLFDSFCKPSLDFESKMMDRVIFHMDGRGMANHIESILGIDTIHAIEWEQGLGSDAPIMQWVGLIKLIQSQGKSIVVNMTLSELEPFMSEVSPEGIFLRISVDDNLQDDVLERLLHWK